MRARKGWLLILVAWCLCDCLAFARPNVVLIMTDDQGWGDFGFHNNPVLKTPNLDALAAQSLELTRFHVSPVCSPTRASLLTGRYNYRTGAIDTYLGRSTMAAEETTLAEMLSAAGYRTGIFGKWHLGDNYPSRAMDQGFQKSLVHRGGGIGQPADPPGNHYNDPLLLEDGREVSTRGYCSDVFTTAAIDFIRQHREQPFFAYLAFNCPHTPLELPRGAGNTYAGQVDEDTAKLYTMVANADENIGRLIAALDELKLAANTVVIFLTDNGPQSRRYNGDLKDVKGSVHDGGIRVPCLVRWPGVLEAGRKIDAVTAHIDLTPTILELCKVERPNSVAFDGLSLAALLSGKQRALAERKLFFQWHRGDQPERFRACAIRSSRYKLVQPVGREDRAFSPAWALYDMQMDPGETNNVIEANQDLAQELKTAYERWFDDVGRGRGYPVPRIVVGTPRENPLTLTRQDWRGATAGWAKDSLGSWEIEVAAPGAYDVTLRAPVADVPRAGHLRIGDVQRSEIVAAGQDHVTFERVMLPAARAQVEASFERDGKRVGVHYVDLFARGVPKGP
jgi:arylsulfatase A-like enzyme